VVNFFQADGMTSDAEQNGEWNEILNLQNFKQKHSGRNCGL
jgi:hypothetical protein